MSGVGKLVCVSGAGAAALSPRAEISGFEPGDQLGGEGRRDCAGQDCVGV